MKKFVVPALILVLSACSQKEEDIAGTPHVESDMQPVKDTAAYTVTDSTKFKFDFALANIPSPANAVQSLNNFGVEYDNTVLNDPDKADRYTTDQSRAINLGIYNIDMAYAMLNDKGEDVLNYMKSVLYLGDQLGLRSAVTNMVGQRAEKNLHNRDSLFTLLDEIFVKSDSYLRNNERVYTAAMIFAGSWIESLHLTCKISEAADEKASKRGRRLLWEQRFHLGNLITVLGDYRKNPECEALLNDLRPIHSEITAVRQDTAMTNATFSQIAGKISTLRNKWTGARS